MCGQAQAVEEEPLVVDNLVASEFAANTYRTRLERAAYRRKILKTLRRIPEPIFLDLATRDLDLGDGTRCVVGYVVREALSNAASEVIDPDDHDKYDVAFDSEPASAAAAFGGTEDDWYEIYYGVTDHCLPDIELAFIARLDEIVGKRGRARRRGHR